MDFSSFPLTSEPKGGRRWEAGGHQKLQSSEGAGREGTGRANGLQVWPPACQMRQQLQQRSDTQLKKPCSTAKCCGERQEGIKLLNLGLVLIASSRI